MNFGRIEAFILVVSLLGFSHAHRIIRPRALSSTQAGPVVTPQLSTPTNSKARSTTAQTVPSNSNTRNATVSSLSTTNRNGYTPDHPDWFYLNGLTWWKVDPTQQDHLRFHAYLSMASYGDYLNCRKTFTKGFTVLEKFETAAGQGGFVALIPEMDKVVIVFRGIDNLRSLDMDEVSIEDLVSDCKGCTVAAGVKKLYLSAKQATNNWAVAINKVAETKLKFSVTGHGVGGAVAVLAGLDLGAQNLVHYSQNQAMPRLFNYQSTVRHDNLFQALAGQSIVAENDYLVQSIPPGPYYHVGTKVKISGDKQQWLTNCYGNNENITCGGDGHNHTIQNTYFTPKGQCGSVDKGW